MSYREFYLLVLLASFGCFVYLVTKDFKNQPIVLSIWITSLIFIVANEIARRKVKE